MNRDRCANHALQRAHTDVVCKIVPQLFDPFHAARFEHLKHISVFLSTESSRLDVTVLELLCPGNNRFDIELGRARVRAPVERKGGPL